MTETSPFLWIETGFPLNGLIYINGVVAGYNGSVIYASRDGINWDAYDTGVALQYVFPHGGKLYFSFSFRRPYAIPHIWDPSSIIQVASLVDYGCYDPETDLITTCSGQVRQDMTTGNILSNMPAFIVTDDNFLLSVPNIVSATNYWYTGGACYLAWNLITNEVIMRGLGDLPVPNHGTYHSAYWYSYRPIRIGDDIYVFGYDTDSRYNGSIIFKHSSQDGGDWIAIDHGMENLRNSNGFILPPRPAAYFTDMWLSNSDKLMFLHRENTVYETATRDNSENYDIYSLGYSCKSLSFGSNYFVAVDGLKYNYAKMSHLGHLNENTLWNEGTLPVFSTKIIALRNGIFIVNGGAIGIFTTDIQESHLNDYKGIFPFNRSKLFTGYYGIRFTMKPEENSSQKDIKPVIIDSLILPVVSAVTSASSLIASDSATFTAAAQNTTAYQWQKMVAEQWTDIEGETETTYTAEFTGTDEGTYYYRCVALNGILKAYSNVLTLIVIVVPKPIVSIISSASSLIAPDSATFTAAAQNTTAYQWQKMVAEQWTDIEGATGTTLTESFTITDTGTKYYRCKVTGSGGTVHSETITLIVSPPPTPTVTVTSSASSLIAPGSVTLTAAAENTISYQWQQSADNEQWTDIEGSTGTTYTESFTITDAGTKYYRCKVTGKGGTAYSETITLTVSLPPAPIVMISGVTVDLSTVEDTREVPAEPSLMAITSGITGDE